MGRDSVTVVAREDDNRLFRKPVSLQGFHNRPDLSVDFFYKAVIGVAVLPPLIERKTLALELIMRVLLVPRSLSDIVAIVEGRDQQERSAGLAILEKRMDGGDDGVIVLPA